MPHRLAALLVLLAAPALAGPADDCRDPSLPHANRVAPCSAAIEVAADARDRADLLLFRAQARRELGDRDGAMADIDAAEALQPGWADPLVERAWLFEAAGDLDAMVAELARARAAEPGSRYAMMQSLNLLPDAGLWDQCLDLAPEARRRFPDDAETHAYLGRCQADGGLHAAAIKSYDRAIALGMEGGFLHSNLAWSLLATGQPEAALPEARTGVALDPANPLAHLNLIDALLTLGDPDGALAAYAAARPHLGADEHGVADMLAWRLYDLGRAADALPVIEGWLDAQDGLGPEDARPVDTYAHVLAALGRQDEAVRAFAKAADLAGPDGKAGYAAALARLGFHGDLVDALRACVATGAACRLDG